MEFTKTIAGAILVWQIRNMPQDHVAPSFRALLGPLCDLAEHFGYDEGPEEVVLGMADTENVPFVQGAELRQWVYDVVGRMLVLLNMDIAPDRYMFDDTDEHLLEESLGEYASEDDVPDATRRLCLKGIADMGGDVVHWADVLRIVEDIPHPPDNLRTASNIIAYGI